MTINVHYHDFYFNFIQSNMSYLREIHPACEAAENENEGLVCMCGLVYMINGLVYMCGMKTFRGADRQLHLLKAGTQVCFREGTIPSSSPGQ